MSNESKSLGVLERVLRVISALIAILAGVPGVIRLLQGNAGIVTLILLSSGIGLLWLGCVYIYSRKIVLGQALGVPDKRHAYSRKLRHLALAGSATIPLFAIAGFFGWKQYQNRPSDQIIILLADFDGPDPKNYRVTENIYERLNQATAGDSSVEVRLLGEIITLHQGSKYARARGEAHKASIVLWGYYGKTEEKAQISSHFEVLQKLRYFPLREHTQILNVAIAELDRYEIQLQLSQEMSCLTLIALGLGRYESGDYAGASARFDSALALSAVPESVVNPADIHFLHGNANMFEGNLNGAVTAYNQAIQLRPGHEEAYINRGTAYSIAGEPEQAIANYDSVITRNANHTLAHNNRGVARKLKGDFEGALTDLNRAIDLDAVEAMFLLYSNRGLTYSGAGDHDRAIQDFTQAIALGPNNADSYLNRGSAYLAKGDSARAKADFNMAEKLTSYYADFRERPIIPPPQDRPPEKVTAPVPSIVSLPSGPDPVTCYNLGRQYAGTNDYNRAIANFSRAITLKPDYVAAYIGRGLAYVQTKKYPAALNDFSRALQYDSTNAEAYYHRGNAYLQRGDYESALADYNRAVKHKPDYAEAQESLVNAYKSRSRAYIQRGDDNKAIQDLDQVIRLNPVDAHAYNDRGKIYFQKGSHERAIIDFEQAIKNDPGFAEAYQNRGDAYADQRQYDQAIADYDKVIALKPEHHLAYFQRGLAHKNKGGFEAGSFSRELLWQSVGGFSSKLKELDSAFADFDKAIARKPKLAEAHFNRGQAFAQRGDYGHALADFDEAIKLEPKHALAYYSRGVIHKLYDRAKPSSSKSGALLQSNPFIRQGNPDLALADFDHALTLKPDLTDVYLNRGQAHAQMGDFDRALADFDQALHRKSKDVLAYYYRGFARKLKGDKDGAIADFREARKLTNDPNMIKQVMQQLQELGND